VLPLCLPGVLELNYKINTIVRDSLKSSVESVTSILMIILMLLIIVFLSVFFCVNIYSETIEVAYLGKDLINKTITDRPELIDILPANMQSLWMFILAAIPVFLHLIYTVGAYTGITQFVCNKISEVYATLRVSFVKLLILYKDNVMNISVVGHRTPLRRAAAVPAWRS